MSNKIQVFDLSNTSDISLTKDGFRKKGDSAKYFRRSPMLPLFSWVTTRSSPGTRNCLTISRSVFPMNNRRICVLFLMRLKRTIFPIVRMIMKKPCLK